MDTLQTPDSPVDLTEQAGVPYGWRLTQLADPRGNHFDLVDTATPLLAFSYRFDDGTLTLRVFVGSDAHEFLPLVFDADTRTFTAESGEYLTVATSVGGWLWDRRSEFAG